MRAASITPVRTAIPATGYSQAVGVAAGSRLLFVSGQIAVESNDVVPQGFGAQCRQVWASVIAALDAARMDRTNIVKVTTVLSDRAYRTTNSTIRRALLATTNRRSR
jgi:enamine deaminase RidA (YjgF/YER057c/UK114 family)